MITTKDLFKTKTDCCGCESCVGACPKEIIRMKADYDGFLYPEAINPLACIDCKKCLKVCPLKVDYKGDTSLYHRGGYYADEEIVKECASGGLATAISRQFIKNGGIVYGVKYASDFHSAEFTRCDDINQLDALKGSKYIQASKGNLYKQIRDDLRKQEVLLIALPCEIHAAKILFGNNSKFYTAALVCHGPISPLVQKEYITNLQRQYPSEITAFTVRHKFTGWKPYYIKADFADGTTFKEIFHPSTYGIAFSELKRPSCAKCKFKLTYSKSTIDADIILGDYHGVTPSESAYNKWGASQVSVLTPAGTQLVDSVSEIFNLYPISARKAIHYNKALDRIIKPRWNRNQFARTLSEKGLQEACKLKSIAIINTIERSKSCLLHFLAKTAKKILKR